jgi:hypothetical protein
LKAEDTLTESRKSVVNILNPKMINEVVKNIAYGKKVALFTFLVATFLIALFYWTEFAGIIYFSLFFFISAFIINTYTFCLLSKDFFNEKEMRKTIVTTILLLFINIPIGLVYFEIGFRIYNAMAAN